MSCAWDLGDHADPAHGRVAYAIEGSAFVSGAAIQWLRDGLGIIASTAEIGPLAESVSDSGGVTFVPALTGLGSPWWDPHARGLITGLTRGAGRAQIARACVEAMAFQVRDMTDAMAAASSHPLVALRADGGAAAMDLLLMLQAEQSRMPMARPAIAGVDRAGAATVAGLAEGVWSSLDELAGLWEAETVFEPRATGRVDRRRARGAGGARSTNRWAGPTSTRRVTVSGHGAHKSRVPRMKAAGRGWPAFALPHRGTADTMEQGTPGCVRANGRPSEVGSQGGQRESRTTPECDAAVRRFHRPA